MKGLIPAHAGKTTTETVALSAPWAHPRSRGENSMSSRMFDEWSGSSPLTRGKQSSLRSTKTTKRLIPAHAGKTRRAITLPAPSRAHPRSRGENVQVVIAWPFRGGSSPLTRGKRPRRVP